jgi:hypothetical protein
MVLLCFLSVKTCRLPPSDRPRQSRGKQEGDVAQLLLTEHARIRMDARRIGTTAVEMALLFGREKHVRGATFFAIGRREVNWFGLNGVDLRRYEGIQVICAEDNVVVTAYRNKDLSNLRSRRPRRRN